jgi:sec-independent protein translocase protein TatB
MFGVDSSELLIVAVLALLFIGPKELPAAMLRVGRFVGKARGYARHFTSGIENVIREAELEEMEKKWRAENERIMALHPPEGEFPEHPAPVDQTTEPQMLPLPTAAPAPDVDQSQPSPPKRPLP